jgi:two-component system sensor histidine kinase/response regulator
MDGAMMAEDTEPSRLRVLRSLKVLDTGPESLFDAAVQAAAAACRTPIALVSFVDEDRQWFKARVGLDTTETPHEISFCAHVVAGGELLVVNDATTDPRFSTSPFVTGPPHIRFYAGAPIRAEGFVLGSVCVIDTEPRQGLEEAELQALSAIARMVSDALALRADALAGAESAVARGHLAAIVDSSDDAILSKTLDGTILSWNAGAAHLYGYTSEEIVGRNVSDLVPEDRPDEVAGILERLRAGERIEHFETVRVRKDGSRMDVSLSISPIRDSEGRITAASTIARDIGEQKRLAAELEIARDQALEASRLKSDFLATMSHEIRTPLNGVIGMTGVLLDTELDADQRRYAEMVRISGEALLAVINDILDFSKIEANRLDLEAMDFDLASAVEDVADMVADRAQAKRLEVGVLIDHDVPAAVCGDPGRVRQVLLNLVSNAIKFTGVGGEVVIRCSAQDVSEESVVVRVDVADTGVGISEQERQRLFEPFSQADSSTSRVHGGTGLGLAISKRLVELMHGDLTVESAPGQGSTFTVTIPFRLAEAGSARPTLPPRDLAHLHVLIVDDNATNRMILEHQVSTWGMRHASAADATAALDLLDEAQRRGDRFDVALVDVEMPGMDGLELARRIVADRRLEGLPVLLLTSAGVRGSVAGARAAGVAAYLAKPVRASHLYDAIVTVVGTPPDAPMVIASTIARGLAERRPPILIVEDNAVNQQVASAMLAKLGYRSDVASNGREALEAIDRVRYGAVLMDCQMPEMDGFEATDELRRLEPSGRHLPVIALTAGAMKGERERCVAAGMDDYLSKPVKLEQLAAVLKRWTGDHPRTSAAPDTESHAEDPALDAAQIDELRSLADSPDGQMQLAHLVSNFADGAHTRVAELQEAVAAGDLARVRSLAHSLAGTSATFGAAGIRNLAARLEATEDTAELSDICDRLASTIAEVEPRLRAALGLHEELDDRGRS